MDSRAFDPDMNILKHQLYELKQVYPDYSYEQLLELMDTIQTEEDYYRLLGQEESYFIKPLLLINVFIWDKKSHIILYCSFIPKRFLKLLHPAPQGTEIWP